MPWPSRAEFSGAVQNPSLAFSDPDLRACQAQRNALGLPLSWSGGFGIVFRMQCGPRSWAVKCFTREVPDQERRYRAIGSHLSRCRLPYTADFQFLRDGIRVGAAIYPILKMEWLEGASLKDHLAGILGEPRALRALTGQWREMIAALQRHEIAHGDLQDQNVRVVNGQLRLIDYDGMYVPALAGLRSNETGARHYQHPRRTPDDFGPYLDDFSGWSIYLSLIGLAADPALWRRFRVGEQEECLLLRKEDYQQPDRSQVLRALLASGDAQVRMMTNLFRQLLTLPLKQLPSLAQYEPPNEPLRAEAEALARSLDPLFSGDAAAFVSTLGADNRLERVRELRNKILNLSSGDRQGAVTAQELLVRFVGRLVEIAGTTLAENDVDIADGLLRIGKELCENNALDGSGTAAVKRSIADRQKALENLISADETCFFYPCPVRDRRNYITLSAVRPENSVSSIPIQVRFNITIARCADCKSKHDGGWWVLCLGIFFIDLWLSSKVAGWMGWQAPGGIFFAILFLLGLCRREVTFQFFRVWGVIVAPDRKHRMQTREHPVYRRLASRGWKLKWPY